MSRGTGLRSAADLLLNDDDEEEGMMGGDPQGFTQMLQDLSYPAMGNAPSQNAPARPPGTGMPSGHAGTSIPSVRDRQQVPMPVNTQSSISVAELFQRLKGRVSGQQAIALENLQEQHRMYPNKLQIGPAIRQMVPKETLQQVLQEMNVRKPQMTTGPPQPVQSLQPPKGISTAKSFAELQELRRQLAGPGAPVSSTPKLATGGMQTSTGKGTGGTSRPVNPKSAAELLKQLEAETKADAEKKRRLEAERKRKQEAETKKRDADKASTEEEAKRVAESNLAKEEAERKKKEEQLRRRRENAERRRREAAEKKKQEANAAAAMAATATTAPSTASKQQVPAFNPTNQATAPPITSVGMKRSDPPAEHPGPPAKKQAEAKRPTGDEELDILKDAGVNLEEETEALVAGLHADEAKARKERYEKIVEEDWLQKNPMQRLLETVKQRYNIESVDENVHRLVSLATKARFSQLMERLVVLSKQRTNADLEGIEHNILWDPKREVMRIERREREKLKRRQEAEREALLRAAEAKKLKEDDQEKLQKALQEREDRTRTAAANKAAMSAFGKDSKWSKWQKMASSKTKKDEKDTAEGSVPSKVDHQKSPSKPAEESNQAPPVVSRILPASFKQRSSDISLRDCIAMMEMEPCYAKSVELFQLYELKTPQHRFSAICRE